MKISTNLDIMLAVFLMIFLCFQSLYGQEASENLQKKYSSLISLTPTSPLQKYFPLPSSGFLEPFSPLKNTLKKELALFLAQQANQEQLYSMADTFYEKFLGGNASFFSSQNLLEHIDFLIARGNGDLAQKLLHLLDGPSTEIRKQWIKSLNTSCRLTINLEKIDKAHRSPKEQQMLFLLEKRNQLLSKETLPQNFFEEILQKLKINNVF